MFFSTLNSSPAPSPREISHSLLPSNRNMKSNKKKIIPLFSVVFGACMFFGYSFKDTFSNNASVYYTRTSRSSNAEGCIIPTLNPFDNSIRQYIEKPSPLTCKQLQYELTTVSENGTISVNQGEVERSKYGNLEFKHRCFEKGESDEKLHFHNWTVFTDSIHPKCEFSEVEAKLSSFPYSNVYSNMYAQILRKEEAKDVPLEEKKQYDVLLFVMDSVSHSNWIRNLPKTLDVLKKTYKSQIFNGFNKIGDNSFPNGAAFLTGKRTHVAGYESELPDDMSDKFFDDWPLIWKNYTENGYKTFYAEDYVYFNLFNYLANGFKQKQFTHSMHHFWRNLYGSYLHRKSTPLCFGNRKMHDIQLDYLEKFLGEYTSEPIFALNWHTELGHDFINQVNQGDEDISKFFERNYDRLKNSFVFVMADHGHRFDAIRNTLVGRLEERLPFFSMHLPEDLVKNRPELEGVVKKNAGQLTSFYDLHATLVEILNLKKDEETMSSVNDTLPIQRGMSLLRPIPANRNCDQAGIPDEFCVCQQESPLEVSASLVQKSADVLLSHVNSMLKEQEDCEELELKKINYAHASLPNKRTALSGSMRSSEFRETIQISITVSPSDAVLEGMLHYRPNADKFEVIGDISRINKYGTQGNCVNSPLLRKYCYCKKQKK